MYLVGTGLILAAALSPLAFWGLNHLADRGLLFGREFVPLHRVFNRVFTLLMLIGLWIVLRRNRLINKKDLGFGISKIRFFSQFFGGFFFGAASMGAIVGFLYFFGPLEAETGRTAAYLARAFFKGTISGIGVVILEESLFRGAMMTAVERRHSQNAAVIISAFIYGLLHFLVGKHKTAQVTWHSGFEYLGESLLTLTRPEVIAPLATLIMVGLLLAKLKQASGHIAGCMGVHAGWVAMIYWGERATYHAPSKPSAWLISPIYNDILGVFSLTVTVVFSLIAVWALGRYGRRLRQGGTGNAPPDQR